VRAYKHWMDILDGYTGWICMDIPPWKNIILNYRKLKNMLNI
jgi:hypothetical protein